MSTLGHAPSVVDLASSAHVEHLADAASNMVDQFIPVSLDDSARGIPVSLTLLLDNFLLVSPHDVFCEICANVINIAIV